MKLSWVLFILLLVFVAVFSVQNAEPITVRFLGWQIAMSGALVIQLAALLGGLVGLSVGAWSKRAKHPVEERPTELVTPLPPTNAESTPLPRIGSD